MAVLALQRCRGHAPPSADGSAPDDQALDAMIGRAHEHRQREPLPACAEDDRLDLGLGGLEGVTLRTALEDEALEVAEASVDHLAYLPGVLDDVGRGALASGAGGRGQDLTGVAAEAIDACGDVLDVALEHAIPSRSE